LFLSHCYTWDGNVVELEGGAQYTNHSPNPNFSTDPIDDMYCCAQRDIEAGEELFDDYGCYPHIEWFEAICTEYGVQSAPGLGRLIR